LTNSHLSFAFRKFCIWISVTLMTHSIVFLCPPESVTSLHVELPLQLVQHW
jgi:hypothetical protein